MRAIVEAPLHWTRVGEGLSLTAACECWWGVDLERELRRRGAGRLRGPEHGKVGQAAGIRWSKRQAGTAEHGTAHKITSNN
jgi:hypothetical protein